MNPSHFEKRGKSDTFFPLCTWQARALGPHFSLADSVRAVLLRCRDQYPAHSMTSSAHLRNFPQRPRFPAPPAHELPAALWEAPLVGPAQQQQHKQQQEHRPSPSWVSIGPVVDSQPPSPVPASPTPPLPSSQPPPLSATSLLATAVASPSATRALAGESATPGAAAPASAVPPQPPHVPLLAAPATRLQVAAALSESSDAGDTWTDPLTLLVAAAAVGADSHEGGTASSLAGGPGDRGITGRPASTAARAPASPACARRAPTAGPRAAQPPPVPPLPFAAPRASGLLTRLSTASLRTFPAELEVLVGGAVGTVFLHAGGLPDLLRASLPLTEGVSLLCAALADAPAATRLITALLYGLTGADPASPCAALPLATHLPRILDAHARGIAGGGGRALARLATRIMLCAFNTTTEAAARTLFFQVPLTGCDDALDGLPDDAGHSGCSGASNYEDDADLFAAVARAFVAKLASLEGPAGCIGERLASDFANRAAPFSGVGRALLRARAKAAEAEKER